MTTNILRGSKKNTFTPNPKNESSNKMKSVHRAATLERFQKKGEVLEGDRSCLRDRAKTLGKMGKRSSKVIPELPSALEQAKQLFAEGQGKFKLREQLFTTCSGFSSFK